MRQNFAYRLESVCIAFAFLMNIKIANTKIFVQIVILSVIQNKYASKLMKFVSYANVIMTEVNLITIITNVLA